MEKSKIADRIKKKQSRSYQFLIAFFLIASLFTVFGIKPNLETVIKLQNDLKTLKELTNKYDDYISKITDLEHSLETSRDQIPNLELSLPTGFHLADALNDINRASNNTGFNISNINIDEIKLREDQAKNIPGSLQSYTIKVDGDGDFTKIQTFIKDILAQGRLKSIESVNFSKNTEKKESIDNEATPPVKPLRTSISIKVFYLSL